MRIIKHFLIVGLFGTSAVAQVPEGWTSVDVKTLERGVSLAVPVRDETTSGVGRVLDIRYHLDCHGNLMGTAPEMVAADLLLPNRTIRFHFFEKANDHTDALVLKTMDEEIAAQPKGSPKVASMKALRDDRRNHYETTLLLGAVTGEVKLKTYANSACELSDVHYRARPMSLAPKGASPFEWELVFAHNPFPILRPGNSLYDDVLMGTAVHIRPFSDGTKTITYHYYFSDENATSGWAARRSSWLPLVSGSDGLMARFGRHYDVEALYTVHLAADGRVLKRAVAIEDWTDLSYSERVVDAKPELVPGTQFPILFLDATTSIFGTVSLDASNNSASVTSGFAKASQRLIGYGYAPTLSFPYPRSREWVGFWQPWMIKVAHQEAVRENKNPGDPTDFLYLAIVGTFRGNCHFGVCAPGDDKKVRWVDADNIGSPFGVRGTDAGLAAWEREGFHAIHMDDYNRASGKGSERIAQLLEDAAERYRQTAAPKDQMEVHMDRSGKWPSMLYLSPFLSTEPLKTLSVSAFVRLAVDTKGNIVSYIYPNVDQPQCVAPDPAFCKPQLPKNFIKYEYYWWW